MAIFLVIPIADPSGVKKALMDNKAGNRLDFIDLPREGFFVSYAGTTKELSDQIGISDGSSGTGIVVAVSSYFGRAPTNIWDWVQSRWDA